MHSEYHSTVGKSPLFSQFYSTCSRERGGTSRHVKPPPSRPETGIGAPLRSWGPKPYKVARTTGPNGLECAGRREEKHMGAGKDLALLVIRIASALAFLFHGSAILFGAFGGPGPAGFGGVTR